METIKFSYCETWENQNQIDVEVTPVFNETTPYAKRKLEVKFIRNGKTRKSNMFIKNAFEECTISELADFFSNTENDDFTTSEIERGLTLIKQSYIEDSPVFSSACDIITNYIIPCEHYRVTFVNNTVMLYDITTGTTYEIGKRNKAKHISNNTPSITENIFYVVGKRQYRIKPVQVIGTLELVFNDNGIKPVLYTKEVISLEDILQKLDNSNRKMFLKNPKQTEYGKETMTVKGQKTYNLLTTILYDLANLEVADMGVINDIVENLDEIVRRDVY